MNSRWFRSVFVLSTIVLAVFAVAALSTQTQAQKKGKNGTTLAASKTIDICEVTAATETSGAVWRYSGEVSVWNEGAEDTQNLQIVDNVQQKPFSQAGPNWSDITGCAPVTLNPTPSYIPAGTTEPFATVFSYSCDADAYPNSYVRNSASVTITNHSGSIGKATGPNPKASWTGTVQPCSTCGCTNSLGYWKNHPGAWPAGYDPNATFFNSGLTWIQVLNATPGGNGYYILAHQYIAAVLSKANGACVPDGIQGLIDPSTTWFNSSTPATCPSPSSCGTQKTDAGILDSYIKGLYPGGPAHCEEN